ncbi:hypothetical protein [Neopusillimonas aromaticivorans]|uniref:hypothetical protein n=1 Tax=Neopusillimonas aromaticivorans TaxID=2979868 RepID=UPI002594864E|nr:hypothetical protein [Neopusillimonas aromaticivorans]WJJ92653.1 hypothetical protein N7E01_09900 [Neopusillimonas aromaticivorans]
MRRVLPTALNRVAVSVNDLPALMARQDRWITETLATTASASASASASATTISRNESSAPVPKAPPADEARTVHTETTANGLNERLQALFREILNVASCTPEDNFFDLGGIPCWPCN